MKTVAIFKWARDPQDARMSVDGTLTWGNAKMSASDDDPAVMEVARAISAEEDIVALTLGDGDAAWAAARGAGKTIIVQDAKDGVDASYTASIMKAAIAPESPDVVLIGDSDWNKAVVSGLVAELGITAYASVVDVKAGDDGYFLVSCKNGSLTNVIATRPPFLLAVKGLTTEKNAPGMKQVLQARKKPQEKITVDSLGAQPSSMTEGEVGLPSGYAVTMIDGSDATAAAKELVEALKRDNVL